MGGGRGMVGDIDTVCLSVAEVIDYWASKNIFCVTALDLDWAGHFLYDKMLYPSNTI